MKYEPPTRYGKCQGTYFYVQAVTTHRGPQGQQLYRLLFLSTNVRGGRLWTFDELTAERVRWLKRKPTRSQLTRS